jgi:hypothetical protein
MKKLILIAIAFIGSQIWAADNSDVLAPLGLSAKCENDIFKHAKASCDRETRGNPDRDHACFYWGDARILRNQSNAAYFEVDFTITDAVVFTYGVSISNKTKCAYKVVSKN